LFVFGRVRGAVEDTEVRRRWSMGEVEGEEKADEVETPDAM